MSCGCNSPVMVPLRATGNRTAETLFLQAKWREAFAPSIQAGGEWSPGAGDLPADAGFSDPSSPDLQPQFSQVLCLSGAYWFRAGSFSFFFRPISPTSDAGCHPGFWKFLPGQKFPSVTQAWAGGWETEGGGMRPSVPGLLQRGVHNRCSYEDSGRGFGNRPESGEEFVAGWKQKIDLPSRSLTRWKVEVLWNKIYMGRGIGTASQREEAGNWVICSLGAMIQALNSEKVTYMHYLLLSSNTCAAPCNLLLPSRGMKLF